MNRLTLDELAHLQWIYNRLCFLYDENPEADYMQKFTKILNKLRHSYNEKTKTANNKGM